MCNRKTLLIRMGCHDSEGRLLRRTEESQQESNRVGGAIYDRAPHPWDKVDRVG